MLGGIAIYMRLLLGDGQNLSLSVVLLGPTKARGITQKKKKKKRKKT